VLGEHLAEHGLEPIRGNRVAGRVPVALAMEAGSPGAGRRGMIREGRRKARRIRLDRGRDHQHDESAPSFARSWRSARSASRVAASPSAIIGGGATITLWWSS